MKVSNLNKSKRAIIIAGGLGSRLSHYTENLPKCMLSVAGKTMLQRQIDNYIANEFHEINIIRGYKKEKINYDHKSINYYDNDSYINTGILEGLFSAKDAIHGDVVVSYSDILFEPHILSRLDKSNSDITIVIDVDWKKTYKGRTDHPINEAENVILDSDNNVLKIGKVLTEKTDVHGEFIGLMRLTKKGSEILKLHYERDKYNFSNKPFQRAKVFEKAYLTDILQDMIDLGVSVGCMIIEGGWKEIDTVQDYENALREFSDSF
jgi:choline kinase